MMAVTINNKATKNKNKTHIVHYTCRLFVEISQSQNHNAIHYSNFNFMSTVYFDQFRLELFLLVIEYNNSLQTQIS